MPGYNTAFLVIACGVTGQLEDLRSQVLQYGSKVDFYIQELIKPVRGSKRVATHQAQPHRFGTLHGSS